MAQTKRGRPPVGEPKIGRIFVRVDQQTRDKLKACQNALNLTTSDIVRKGIDSVYEDLKK